MAGGLLGTDVVTQIGIIVRDIEKTSQAFADFFGVEKPKWFLTDTIDKTQATYRGEPCYGRAKLAFFKLGNLDIELIEPDEHPSTWREFLDQHGEGVHHIAFVIQGMQEKITLLAGRDMPLVQKGEYTGGRYAYIDTVPQLKVAIELLEND
ncbi:lactoylglutathione lyase [Alicyclobacillus cellulosilyticus]|uniref:Lactoylglutathione lyase n=1 Tax=Alicyclobacillus cellulosilyticus TaxID=1003997 RepID=A0A917NNT7_9BACL|nr:VOC family protein [Alicyclobacillus cellulosilyticus]GGJ14148.1 lactoylglutathione lyase [Alicyclobacillus cellulosilyticus]